MSRIDPQGTFFFVAYFGWTAAAALADLAVAGGATWWWQNNTMHVSSDTSASTPAIDTASSNSSETCNNNDKCDPCDKKLDKALLKLAGILGMEHEVKQDWLGKKAKISLFDLCGCRDGRVVIKTHGCKGDVLHETGFNWKK